MKVISSNPFSSLKPGEVHFWLFDLDSMPPVYPAWERLLSAEEVARSKHYQFDNDRLRFISRRGILHHLLGKYNGLDPAEISFITNPFGKPSFPSSPFTFNLSVSQNQVACV